MMRPMSILIKPHVLHLRAAGRPPSTCLARARVLTAADRALPYGIDTATADELRDYFANDDWSAWTRCTYFNHVAGFYTWATEGDDAPLDYNPLAALTRPKNGESLPNPVTDEQLTIALEGAGEWWRPIILLAAFAGLRAGEIVALTREHVTQERIRVVLGKGGKSREIPTHPQIWDAVGSCRGGPIVRGQKCGRPVTRSRLSLMARSCFNSLGLHDVYMHRFRHWFATTLIKNGVDLLTVQQLMGHASPVTTAGYTRIANGQRRLAISTLPVLNGSPLEAPSARYLEQSGAFRQVHNVPIPRIGPNSQLLLGS